MNSLERIQAAIGFGEPDRVPVVAQVFGHTAILAGLSLEEYVRDGEVLARCQLDALAYYDYDAVFAVMDVNVETEAVGSVLAYRAGLYPVVESYVLSRPGELDRLALPDPYQSGRMPEMLRAIRILRAALRDETMVVGAVLGPLTLAIQLMGAEAALFRAADEPDWFASLLDFAVDVAICYGVAQIEAGAHLPMVFDPGASPAVVPPQFFREFELPRLKRVFDALGAAGAAANWLHIAGPTDHILAMYPEMGVTIANFDYYVAPESAQGRLPGVCLDGNIKSFTFVDCSPEGITEECTRLCRKFAHRGGFILSSGCEIPPESEPENVVAMVRAARACC